MKSLNTKCKMKIHGLTLKFLEILMKVNIHTQVIQPSVNSSKIQEGSLNMKSSSFINNLVFRRLGLISDQLELKFKNSSLTKKQSVKLW